METSGNWPDLEGCVSISTAICRREVDAGTAGFLDFRDRLQELSANGDPLEKLAETLDFELSHPVLEKELRQRGFEEWTPTV